MLQLKNATPFTSSFAVFPDREGIETLYVVIKATLALPNLVLTAKQVPVTLADEYVADPESSSLKASTELHVGKAGTDVVLLGHAHAPNGRPVDRMYVGLEVAERRVIALVTGDRQWRGSFGGSTAPVPFVTMPLQWERSYGGTVLGGDGRALSDEQNPVGRGFPGKRLARDVQGQPLPNIEDPQRPLSDFGQMSVPIGFGFVAPSWLPRRTFAGTYDQKWQETRAPYLPADFNPRFLNAAPGVMAFDRHLSGGEVITVNGAWREGLLRFQVPTAKPSVSVTIAGSKKPLTLLMDQVTIEPDESRLCLSWRGGAALPRGGLTVEAVQIS